MKLSEIRELAELINQDPPEISFNIHKKLSEACLTLCDAYEERGKALKYCAKHAVHHNVGDTIAQDCLTKTRQIIEEE